MNTFDILGLAEPLLRAVRGEGYLVPTPIQVKAIPPLLSGRDLVGCAQTGTGKTAAFALPVLDRLGRNECRVNSRGRKIRALVLAPTRELASQIGASFSAYGRHVRLRHTLVYGGVSQNPQVHALNGGVDILVATPGRLLDLMDQGYVDLAHVEILILDEADRMLDMGFIRDLRRIVAQVPTTRQTLLFSATMPDEIRRLAAAWLRDPVNVQVAPAATPVETVQQSVRFVDQRDKPRALTQLLKDTAATRILVFTRTKHGADKVMRHLVKGGVRAEAIHGNKSQAARERVLRLFKSSQPPVLVATDVAARGLDIDEISHVVNFDLPLEPETYVHRIGRTARAGASGIAVSFCDRAERSQLRAIEQLTRQTIAVEGPTPQEANGEPHGDPPSDRPSFSDRRGPGAAPGFRRKKRPGGQRSGSRPHANFASARPKKTTFARSGQKRSRQRAAL
jgi:ATP-dependent RNA helicase RhlE